MTTPEGKLAQYLISRCRSMGLAQRKTAYESRRGCPDRLVLGEGHHAFIELKAAGQKPRREQVHEIELLNRAGLKAYVASSKEEIDRILEEMRSAHGELNTSPVSETDC